MSTDEKMTIDERVKYLRVMKKRYAKASRKEKGRLLDEMETVTGYNRKYLVQQLRGGSEAPTTSGRARAQVWR